MGDLFFFFKMLIFTFIIVLVMQVKVGQTTLESKVIQFTHNSQFSVEIQKVAQGAATFLSSQYGKITRNINIPYFNNQAATQKPGDRLKNKIKEIKSSLKEKWSEGSSDLKEEINDYAEDLEE